ncbi:MAG: glycosyltransferase family 9 protein [Alphaproteobacteria bacterium]
MKDRSQSGAQMAKGNILFITWSRLGDALLSNGLLDHLAKTVPNARITVACGPVAAELYRDAPGVVHVHVMRKGPRAKHWRELWWLAVKTRWEYVVDLRSSAIAYTLWAKHRKVFKGTDDNIHKAAQVADLFGVMPQPATAWASAALVENVSKEFPSAPLIAIGPTANWHGKQWPGERFAVLAHRLIAPDGPFAGHRVLVLGGPGEEDRAAPVLKALGDNAVDLVGKLTPRETFAALTRARFFIGNDSGLMHMACAARLPTVALFGPSNEAIYGPFGVPHRVVRGKAYAEITGAPDYVSHGPHLCYMEDITTEMVLAATVDLAQECGLLGAAELE